MGVDLSPLIEEGLKQDIQLDNLNGKRLSIDAYNAIYQFLTTIRGEDGSPLMDSHGRITSHLSGLFYRTVNFIEKGLKVVYVFDGKPPELKAKEIEERRKTREEALKMYEEARAQGNEELMKKFATRAAFLKNYMVEDSKTLLDLMGVPWVEAPSEGEAQAAYMAARGVTWGSVSQDYDSLLFGSPRLVRNLTVSGRRKLPNKDVYIEISPEMIETEKLLKFYEITREQLVDIGILVGTDFNVGIKGIGPKTALKLVKKYGKIENIKEVPSLSEFLPPEILSEVRKIFLEPQVKDVQGLEWRQPDEEGVIKFLCDERNFSVDRVKNALTRIRKRPAASSLDQWF
ncbi:MAG: flap endonuclease-1 [Nitrososphaeria archaeon]|jgi:flap endonuclease 1 (EC 3.1.-.-)